MLCSARSNMQALRTNLEGESAMLALDQGLRPVTTVLQTFVGFDEMVATLVCHVQHTRYHWAA